MLRLPTKSLVAAVVIDGVSARLRLPVKDLATESLLVSESVAVTDTLVPPDALMSTPIRAHMSPLAFPELYVQLIVTEDAPAADWPAPRVVLVAASWFHREVCPAVTDPPLRGVSAERTSWVESSAALGTATERVVFPEVRAVPVALTAVPRGVV